MKVDQRVYQSSRLVGLILEFDPLSESTQVVAQVWHSSWLNAGEDDLFLGVL